MRGNVGEPLSLNYRDLAAEEHRARPTSQRWPAGLGILFVTMVSAVLWIAIYWGIQGTL